MLGVQRHRIDVRIFSNHAGIVGHHARYEVRHRKDKRGVDLISDVLPFGRLRYDTPDNAIGYAQFYSRSHNAVIHVYDTDGNVIETHERKGDFKEW